VLAKIIERFAEVERERLTRALAACSTVSIRSVEIELNRITRPENITRIEQRRRLVAAVTGDTEPEQGLVAQFFAALPSGQETAS
jgi:hypothetical protein